MKKLVASIAVLLAFGFLSTYAVSVYIHRNDNRFKSTDNPGAALDTRTGQLCLTVRAPQTAAVASENSLDKALNNKPVPFCGDIK